MSDDIVEVPSARFPDLLLMFTLAGGKRVQWHVHRLERVPPSISEEGNTENRVWVAGGTSKNARKAAIDAENAALVYMVERAEKAAAMHELRRELGLL